MRNFPFDKPGQYYRGNIHSHSTNSDGLLSPSDVVNAYRDRDYDFVAITDHFMGRYNFPITDSSPFRTSTFTTLFGAEIHVPGLQNGIVWDLLAVGLPVDFAPVNPDEVDLDLVRRASAAGAFVAIPHPGWNGVVHSDGARIIDHVDAIEIHNEGHTLDSDRGSGWYLADSLATAGHRHFSAFAADDAHFKNDRFDRFGGWINVKAESLDPESLLAAMKAGNYYSSTGATIRNVEVTPTEIIVETDPAIGIMLGGPGTVRQYVRGEDLTRATFTRSMFQRGFFRVIVIEDYRRKAWSSPIWLDEFP
ncbi:MAG TPA: hypothetical protein VD767_06235 [Thermomicrobiales bacterium]|nr:hypothetical protein [Thermomicrobiales bacterium]